MSIHVYTKDTLNKDISTDDGKIVISRGDNTLTSAISDASEDHVKIGKLADGTYGIQISSGAMHMYDAQNNPIMENGYLTATGINIPNLSALTEKVGILYVGGGTASGTGISSGAIINEDNLSGQIIVNDKFGFPRTIIDSGGLKTCPITITSGTELAGTSSGALTMTSSGYRVWLGSLHSFLDFTNHEYGIGIGETNQYFTYTPSQGVDMRGDLTIGGANNQSGQITVLSGNGSNMTTINKDGVTLYDGNFRIQDDNSSTIYKLGSGDNLLKDHNFESMHGGYSESYTYHCSAMTEEAIQTLSHPTHRFAQKFKYTRTGDFLAYNNIYSVGFLIKKALNEMTMVVRIETDVAGKPSGVLADANLTVTTTKNRIIGKASGLVDEYSKLNNYYFTEFKFDTSAAPSSGNYWIVIYCTNAGTSNTVKFAHSGTNNIYPYGQSMSSTNGGTTWTNISGNSDFAFFVKTIFDGDNSGESPGVHATRMKWEQSAAIYGLYNAYCYWDNKQWIPVGCPRIYAVYQPEGYFWDGISPGMGGTDDYFLFSDNTIFNRKTPCVNSGNYLEQWSDISGGIQLTASAHFAPRGGSSGDFYGNSIGSGLTARIWSFYYDNFPGVTPNNLLGYDYTDNIITNNYTTSDKNKVIRAQHTFNTHPNTKSIKLMLTSASNEWLRVDGAQLIGGPEPTIYNAESNSIELLWEDGYTARASGTLTPEATPTVIPGCAMTIQLDNAAYLDLSGTADIYTATAGDVMIGHLYIDGVAMTGQIISIGQDANDRKTAGQNWWWYLNDGAHTLELRGQNTTATRGLFYNDHTALQYRIREISREI